MPDESEPDPSFEQALSQLERIVASLERGEPELTSALAKYEKGVQLLTQCYRLLDQAEQSVALLTGVDDEGNPLYRPVRRDCHRRRSRGRLDCDHKSRGRRQHHPRNGSHRNFHAPRKRGTLRQTSQSAKRIRRFDRYLRREIRSDLPSAGNKMGVSGKIYGLAPQHQLCITKFCWVLGRLSRVECQQ